MIVFPFIYVIFGYQFLTKYAVLAMENYEKAEMSAFSFSAGSPSNDQQSLKKSELAANLYSLLNLKTQIQMNYMENESTTMEFVEEYNKKYANFVKELPEDLVAKCKLEKNLHRLAEKWEKVQFKNEIQIIEKNLLIIFHLENKMKQAVEHIEYTENVHEVVQYHLERVHSELYRRKHYKYKLLLLSKWNLPINTQKLVNVFDVMQIIIMLSGYLHEIVHHQETRLIVAKMIDQIKEVEQSLAQKFEIDQKLLRQMQRFDHVPNAWECQEEMQLMSRLGHSNLSHVQTSLIYLHECAFRLSSEFGILVNHLEEIGTEWTNADAIDEVLKSAAGLEQHRQSIIKM